MQDWMLLDSSLISFLLPQIVFIWLRSTPNSLQASEKITTPVLSDSNLLCFGFLVFEMWVETPLNSWACFGIKCVDT